jgi:hypothetical protein
MLSLSKEDFLYAEMMNYIYKCFMNSFGRCLSFIKESHHKDGMNAFYLYFFHDIKGYKITFEYERTHFDVLIEDGEGGGIFAEDVIEKKIDQNFFSSAVKNNIAEMAQLLSKAIREDKIWFYIWKEDKLYLKKDGVLTRINPRKRP